MQTTNPSISNTVMRRVRIIHAARPLVSGTVLAGVLFLVALWGIGREVWVARVFQNMPSLANTGAVLHFYASAFLDTRFIVQALVLVAGVAFIYALIDMARSLTPSHRYAWS